MGMSFALLGRKWTGHRVYFQLDNVASDDLSVGEVRKKVVGRRTRRYIFGLRSF